MSGAPAPSVARVPTLAAMIRRQPVGYVLLGFLSLVASVTQAIVLVLLITAAAGLAGDGDSTVAVGAGILDFDLSPSDAAALAVVLLLTSFVFVTWLSVVAGQLSTRRMRDERAAVLGTFLAADWTTQSAEPAGRLQEVLTAYVLQVGLAEVGAATVVASAVNLAVLVGGAFLIQPGGAIVVVAASGLLFLVLRPIRTLTRKFARLEAEHTRLFAERASESVSLAREIRTFDVEAAVLQGARAHADVADLWGYRTRFMATWVPGLYNFLGFLLVSCSLLAIAKLEISLTGVGAVMLLLVRGIAVSQRLTNGTQQFNSTLHHVVEVERLQALYAAAAASIEGGPLERVERLELRHLDFAYPGTPPALRGIDLSIGAGEAIGLVGPSGSGKSTLVQVLLRLRPADGGEYLVNGVDAASYCAADWYERFALVPQENRVLAGSVADNIRFFREGLTDAQVEAAARRAMLHDEILKLPDGYATMLGHGVELSGGQRQRLGLARALASSPDVLVLDEPTSALDMVSEQLVQEALRSLVGDVTLLIVAHRIPTLALCSRIVVLEDGRLTGDGPSASVAASNAFFGDAVRLSKLA